MQAAAAGCLLVWGRVPVRLMLVTAALCPCPASSLPPEQLASMASMASAAGAPGAAFPVAQPAAPAAAAAAPAAAAAAPAAAAAALSGAAPGSEDQMRAASEALRQNPDMLKQAAAMMEGMSEEQLAAMAAAMPGGGGMQVRGQEPLAIAAGAAPCVLSASGLLLPPRAVPASGRLVRRAGQPPSQPPLAATAARRWTPRSSRWRPG